VAAGAAPRSAETLISVSISEPARTTTPREPESIAINAGGIDLQDGTFRALARGDHLDHHCQRDLRRFALPLICAFAAEG